MLDATIRGHGLDVRVLNTPLDDHADPTARSQQVAELMAAVTASSMPTLLLGDLKAPPDAPELAPLVTRLTDVCGGCTTGGFTHRAEASARRIEHVLVSPSIRVTREWVPAIRASDHDRSPPGSTSRGRAPPVHDAAMIVPACSSRISYATRWYEGVARSCWWRKIGICVGATARQTPTRDWTRSLPRTTKSGRSHVRPSPVSPSATGHGHPHARPSLTWPRPWTVATSS